MKRVLLCGVFLFASIHPLLADIIVQWNFNSPVSDTNTSTGTLTPSVGTGTAQLVGGTSGGFSAATTGDTDPANSSDDSYWSTKDYPVQGTLNKTAGVEFSASTGGYSNIVVRWDHRATTTASKYYRLQYSIDGSSFTDYSSPINISVANNFNSQTNSLASTFGVNNNPGFRFRILSEFESTATGGGLNGYATPYGTNTYNPTGGTVGFDYVTVLGTPIPDGNTPPVIFGPTNQTVRVTQSTGPLSFTILDAEDPATSLQLDKTSSNPSVISTANISFGGSSSSRTVNITAGSQTGSSTITIWVIDTGGKSNSAAFTVTVLPANTAPVISTISPTNTLINITAGPIPFTVGDAETPSSNLTVSAVSSNAALVPNQNISFGGSGSNRTVTIVPASGQIGVAPITVIASDGTNTATSSLALMVLPSAQVIFYDPFNYPDGSLLTNSGFLWANRSGPSGECRVTNGQVQVSADLQEDVQGKLAGASYTNGAGTVLYSSFKVKFLSLPNSTPDYFASFASGNSFHGRVYAFIPTGANFGTLRMGVGNAAYSTEWPVDLTTNVTYTVVLRHRVDTATTTLWLSPSSESDPGAVATDSTSLASISYFAFRQSGSFDATVLVDDLKLGLSFAAVTGTNAVTFTPIPLDCARIGTNLILTWANSGFFLQAAPVATGPFTNIQAATSPWTNTMTGSARFFRLKAN